MIKAIGQNLPDGYVSTALLDKLFPEWTDQASCAGRWDLFDSDIETIMGLDDLPLGMTPELYAGMVERDRRNAEAVKICWTECPVRQQCLKGALEGGFEYTVRGGYTPAERQVISNNYEKGQWSQF
jgi:hypothetical protein